MNHLSTIIVAAGSICIALVAIGTVGWWAFRPLFRQVRRGDQANDAVLGYAAEFDHETGTQIRAATPGLIERMDGFGRNQIHILSTLDKLAENHAAVTAIELAVAQNTKDIAANKLAIAAMGRDIANIRDRMEKPDA